MRTFCLSSSTSYRLFSVADFFRAHPLRLECAWSLTASCRTQINNNKFRCHHSPPSTLANSSRQLTARRRCDICRWWQSRHTVFHSAIRPVSFVQRYVLTTSSPNTVTRRLTFWLHRNFREIHCTPSLFNANTHVQYGAPVEIKERTRVSSKHRSILLKKR